MKVYRTYIYIYVFHFTIPTKFSSIWGKEQKEHSPKSSNVLKASSPPPSSQQSKRLRSWTNKNVKSRAIRIPHQKVTTQTRKVQSLEARALWFFLIWFCSSSFETLSWYLSWASNRLVAWHLSIRLDTVLQTEKFPASIANLDSWMDVCQYLSQ